jgi:CBS domain-containing protein
VDDAGAGYSSLESIAEICPDFIKLDMSLIRYIDTDSIKQALLETFVQFADKVKCSIIAEGIETERELQTLIELGVEYGQGYYVGKPAKGMTQASGAAMNVIRQLQEKRKGSSPGRHAGLIQVAEMVTKSLHAEPNTKVRQIHQMFEQHRRGESVVILEDNKPVGLVMRFQLYQILGGQYGISLYYERPVAPIMNSSPLIVRSDETIDVVAKRAMAREANHLYDVVIVVDEHGDYLGVVSVQHLLDWLATHRLAQAAVATPTPGLPDELPIEREMQHAGPLRVVP